MSHERDDRRAIQHFSDWLTPKLIGCKFARLLSTEEKNLFVAVRGNIPTIVRRLESFVDAGAKDSMPVIAVFSELSSQDEVADLLVALCGQPRWRGQLIESEACPDLIVSLECITPFGHRTRVQGFAPFGTMPPVRRSPYVALVLWPGRHENRFRPSRRNVVSLADCVIPEELDKAAYDQLWKQSQEGTASILTSYHLAIRALLVKTTFILSRRLQPTLANMKVPDQLMFDFGTEA